jgi:hypothetical protein
MAKHRGNPTSAPSLAPERAVPILQRLIPDGDALKELPRLAPKRQQWAHTGEAALIAALGENHPSVEAFGTAQTSFYSPSMTEGELLSQENDQLDAMIAVIKSAVDQLRWKLPDSAEVFLPAGSVHDAYVEIRKVVASAKHEVAIIDPYVDETLWPLLTNLPSPTRIRILTRNMKGDFPLEARKFRLQHGGSVEIRTTTDYHDRFILIDGTIPWHLGASIKDAGTRACAMSEVISPAVRTAIRDDIELTWSGATLVTT